MSIATLMKYKNYSVDRAAKRAIDDLANGEGQGGVICLDNKGKGAFFLFRSDHTQIPLW